MTAISLVENTKRNVELVLIPEKSVEVINEAEIHKLIEASEYTELVVNDEHIKNAIAELNEQLKKLSGKNKGKEIRYQVLERIAAQASINIDKDEMSASAEISTAQGGKHLTAQEIVDASKKAGVKKGFLKQALLTLTQQAMKAPAGTIVSEKIAQGKLPEKGKDTKIKHLVESAQNRILKPQEKEDGTVDMRDLGAIICVKEGDPLAKRIPFTLGLPGFTVTGNILSPEPGEDASLVPGDGTAISPKNNDLLISTMVGLPKITSNGMEVDQVYIVNNVDIGTGHIDFKGSVVIQGDVKESMRVTATGDINIGGFVESATLEAGGDITIGNGIIGKKQEVENATLDTIKMTAKVTAKGNIFAMYSQYAEINCQSDMRIETQLMHNIIHINGSLWVGSEDQANGKLIAGYISANQPIYAGTVGATAGASTIIVFQEKLQTLKAKYDQLNQELQAESLKLTELKNAVKKLKALPKEKAKPELLTKIVNAYQQQAKSLAQAQQAKDDQDAVIQEYMASVFVEAKDRLYQGVEVRLGDFNERTKREYGPSRMRYEARKVIIDPIVNT